MKQYSVTRIGEFHTNHNEDYFISQEIGEDKLMIAVMDGCSMGTDSYFASTLIGKLLRKIGKAFHYKEFVSKDQHSCSEYLLLIMSELFTELAELKNKLQLEREELLSTLILGIINHQARTGSILTIGDGLVCYNGQLIEYEQDDRPDYLGYHLAEAFPEWYEGEHQKLDLKNIEDLSILTDGLYTFKPFDSGEYKPMDQFEIMELLLINRQDQHSENMLKKKLLNIEKEMGLRPTDDLTIIRLIFE
ncbi:MAG: protein phosphatase 2C domain-containing protein [Saprospiraceae bacterium]